MNPARDQTMVILGFVLGMVTAATLGFAAIGSPVAVPAGLLGLFCMWFIHTSLPPADDGEPVTRLTEKDHAPEEEEFDHVGRMPGYGPQSVRDAVSSPAPVVGGVPTGDTGAGETLFVGLGRCPACGEKNCYRVNVDGTGACSRCTYRRYSLPEGPARF